ncbi:MAG: hypothetical protein JWL70_634 [Acidimicrobiia bacterium]|nr:hypothetical protein [Acidimicrobiia bacterium]
MTPFWPPAPDAPGSLAVPPDPTGIFRFLEAMLPWRRQSHVVLSDLDRRAQAATNPDVHTPKVTLAWALWKSLSDRVDAINAVWDSGRVDHAGCARIGALLWGRMGDSMGGSAAVSLPEACTLLEALASQLAQRLDVDPLGQAGVGDRMQMMRDQLTRLAGLGADAAMVTALQSRFDSVSEAMRGGEDQRAVLNALETDLTTVERDAMVVASVRGTIDRDLVRLRQAVIDLRAQEAELRELAQRSTQKIAGVRPLGLPDADVVNEPTIDVTPADVATWSARRAELDAFAARVDQFRRAFAQFRQHYQAPLDRRGELRGLLDSYQAMAGVRGCIENPDCSAAYQAAHVALFSAPCDLVAAAALVAQYEQLVRAHSAPRPHSKEPQ